MLEIQKKSFAYFKVKKFRQVYYTKKVIKKAVYYFEYYKFL